MLRMDFEETDSTSETNEALASDSMSPPNLAISESQLIENDEEDSETHDEEEEEDDEEDEDSSVLIVNEILEDDTLELSQGSSNEPSYLDLQPSIDPPRIDHGVNLSQPPS